MPQHNTLTIDWDSENNVTNVKERVALGMQLQDWLLNRSLQVQKKQFSMWPRL